MLCAIKRGSTWSSVVGKLKGQGGEHVAEDYGMHPKGKGGRLSHHSLIFQRLREIFLEPCYYAMH